MANALYISSYLFLGSESKMPTQLNKRFYIKILLKVFVVFLVFLFVRHQHNKQIAKKKGEELVRMMSITNTFSTAADWGGKFLRQNGFTFSENGKFFQEFDRFLDENIDDAAHRPRPDGLLAKNTDARILVLGAFLGDKVIQRYGGMWDLASIHEDNFIDARIQLPSGQIYSPLQQISKRIFHGSENRIQPSLSGIQRK